MEFVPVRKKEKPQTDGKKIEEKRVKCASCLKEFGAPVDKDEFYCVHCGKKHFQKGQQPAQELDKKGEKKIVSLDALIGKKSSTVAKSESLPISHELGLKRLSEIEEPPAQDEFIEQCQCPVCSTIVAADARNCPACGVQFAGEEEAETPTRGKKEQKPLNVCGSCGKLVPDVDKLYPCRQCGKTFCDSCPTPRIPPEPKSLEAKVVYKYKLKTQTIWTSDAVKFSEPLQPPLCRKCYMGEYDRAFLRLHSKVKSWQIDIRRDADVKFLEEIFPERKEVVKTRKVIPANDFLMWISKG